MSHNDTLDRIIELAQSLRGSGGIEFQSRQKQVRYLCKLLGIEPSDLAKGLIFGREDITATEIAEKLGVSRRMVYKWPGVSTALHAKNQKEFDRGTGGETEEI